MTCKLVIFAVIFVSCMIVFVVGAGRCKNSPNTSKKVADGIKQCQENIKSNMIEEAFHILRYQWTHRQPSTPSKNPVRQIHHLYRPLSFRPLPATQNMYAQHPQPTTLQHRPFAPTIAVNYSEFLTQPNYQSNHVDQQAQHVFHVYADESDPVLMQQVHGGPNSQQPTGNHNLYQQAGYQGIGLQNDYMDLQTVPGDLKYYQYESFDPNTQRRRRSDDSITPSGMSAQDKRIAGCLMHCIYSKHHAVDKMGWPTLDGLVSFYSEGVEEHGYFMATLRASNACLKILSAKYHVNRLQAPAQGQSCDLSFDVFDCISDKITEYCVAH